MTRMSDLLASACSTAVMLPAALLSVQVNPAPGAAALVPEVAAPSGSLALPLNAQARAVARQAIAETPGQAVFQAIAQGDLDDAGLDQDLRALHVEALERGFDAGVIGWRGVDQQRVVDAVGHDAHVRAQRDGGPGLLLRGCAGPGCSGPGGR